MKELLDKKGHTGKRMHYNNKLETKIDRISLGRYNDSMNGDNPDTCRK